MKTKHYVCRKLVAFLFLFCTSIIFSQTRYVDDIFPNVDETKNIVFSNNIPQPLPSAPINLFFVTVPANANVPEHNTQNRNLSMDIFQPRNDNNASRPVIIFCFGGGFTQGNKSAADMRALAIAMTKKGYVTATMDYRLGINLFDEGASKRAVYRGIQDSRSAIRFFRNDAVSNNTYRINPNQVFLAGYSAGGFIALHNIYLDQENERPSSTRAIQYRYSQNSIFGFSNFNIPDLGCLDCAGNNQNLSGKANAAISFAGALGELSYIQGNTDAPALLFHSSNDNTVPFNTGVPYGAGNTRLSSVFGSNAIQDEALRKGAPVRLKSYTNRGHSPHTRGGSNLYPEIVPEIADFLFDVLNGDVVTPPPPPPAEIPLNQIISLRKKGGDRKYVTAERFADNNQLLARATSVRAWERFRVEAHPQGGVALKALSNDKYIQVNGNNQNVPIRAQGNAKLEWEQFVWNAIGPGEVALQSSFTNKWIQAAWPTNNAVLYARGQNALTWETFEWTAEPSNRQFEQDASAYVSEVYPNPVGQHTKISINTRLSKTGTVLIQLYDTSGREVYKTLHKNIRKGGATFTLNIDQFRSSTGVYLLKITKDTTTETMKVIF